VRVLFAGVNILCVCVFANVQNLKIVFLMSRRIVPVSAARLCQSGSRRPVPVDAAAACCRPLCGSLLLLVGGVGACCSPLCRQPKVSDRQMIILKKCALQCVRVCWLVK
jgi:hypothetical protein